MSLPPQSKRKVTARIDLDDRDSPSPSPGPRVVRRGGGVNAVATPPLRRAGSATARAKVDMSGLQTATSPSSTATPPLRRANASTPNASSPFYRATAVSASSFNTPISVGNGPSTASAPVTPRIPASTSARSPSPSFQARSSPFEHNVGSSRTSVGPITRARVRAEGSESGVVDRQSSAHTPVASPFPRPVTTSNLASPPLHAPPSGRMSPARATYARVNSAVKVPSLGQSSPNPSFHAGQSRGAALFPPPPSSSPSTSTPQRSASPARPASPTFSSSSRPTSSLNNVAPSSYSIDSVRQEPPRGSAASPGRGGLTSPWQEEPKRLSRPPLIKNNVLGSQASHASPRRLSSSSEGRTESPWLSSPPARISHNARPATLGASAGARLSGDGVNRGTRPALSHFPSTSSQAALSSLASQTTAATHAFGGPVPFSAPATTSAERSGIQSPPAEIGVSNEAGAANADVTFTMEQTYAQLRVERKIADLEITNRSLLAINSGLEVSKHRQAREIRELKRSLRQGSGLSEDVETASTTLSDRSSYFDEGDDAIAALEEDVDDADVSGGVAMRKPKEDPGLEASHQRCKSMIEAMMQQARQALSSQPARAGSLALNEGSADGRAGGGMKVLNVAEVQERELQEDLDGDESGAGDLSTVETSMPDQSGMSHSSASLGLSMISAGSNGSAATLPQVHRSEAMSPGENASTDVNEERDQEDSIQSSSSAPATEVTGPRKLETSEASTPELQAEPAKTQDKVDDTGVRERSSTYLNPLPSLTSSCTLSTLTSSDSTADISVD
ncbi:unnamed protein product [Jaminaea pallidilutea]